MNPEVERLLDLAARAPSDSRAQVLARECSDPCVRAEVAALLHYADDAESYFDGVIRDVASSIVTRQEPAPGDAVGSYRIRELIGQGGMGSVYLAERADGEIEQRVAIKLLRADGRRTGWRERFLRERQLLASLQHPSIVHVIDAGHTDDGRPFLVMEHVDGVPIDRFAAHISVADRLKLFVQVCDGVSHAHRHLIIHRDLKPSNILVDATGRPKLLDFGIAKLLNETSDLTQVADQLLTPNYASPEQLRGWAQSTATDVYSLGSVLYKLLTGTSPREDTHGDTESEATPPSRIDPDVPADLDFVVRKALRSEPELRYGTVEEFAADIRAVLKGRPVQARGNDVWYRARRYLGRYWVPLAAVLLVLSSLAAGLWIANRERLLAERRFTEVRQLAVKLFDIDVQVAQLPGGSKTRQLIVDTALDYLRRVTADVRMEPGLALELGTAYMRVARVQGVNISPNLGQTHRAEQTARKAQELIDSVLASQPRNRMALLRAGQIAHDRMVLAQDDRRDDEVLRFADQSVARLDQFLATRPLDASADHMDAQQVIIALINVANQYRRADEFDKSIRTARRAIAIAQSTDWAPQAGAGLIMVALANRAKGDLDEALQSIRESVRLLQPEAGESRLGRLQPYGLALIREAQILGEDEGISLNRPREALECIERALKIGEEFARRDASDFGSQYRVFFAETKMADILRHANPARAITLYDDGLRRLAGASANAGTLRNESEALAASVYPLLRLGRRDEAGKRVRAALDRLGRMKLYPATQIELGNTADQVLRALAEYETVGDAARGAARYDEILRLALASEPKPETVLEDALALSNIYKDAAPAHRRAGQNDLASDIDGRRLALWQHWADRLPGNAFVRRQLDAAAARAQIVTAP